MNFNERLFKIIVVWLKVSAIISITLLYNYKENLELYVKVPIFDLTLVSGTMENYGHLLLIPIFTLIGSLIVDGLNVAKNSPWFNLVNAFLATGTLFFGAKMCLWFFNDKSTDLSITSYLRARRIWTFDEKWNFLKIKKDLLLNDYSSKKAGIIIEYLEKDMEELRKIVSRLQTKQEVERAITEIIDKCNANADLALRKLNNKIVYINNDSYFDYGFLVKCGFVIVVGGIVLFAGYQKWNEIKQFFTFDSGKEAAKVSREGLEKTSELADVSANTANTVGNLAENVGKMASNTVEHTATSVVLNTAVADNARLSVEVTKTLYDLVQKLSKDVINLKDQVSQLNGIVVRNNEAVELMKTAFNNLYNATAELHVGASFCEDNKEVAMTYLLKSVKRFADTDFISGGKRGMAEAIKAGMTAASKKDWGIGFRLDGGQVD